MREILSTIVFAGYNVQDLLIVAIAAVVILAVATILTKVLKKDESAPHVQLAVCFNCAWQGKVSRHAGRCPKCNEPLGDQAIKRYNGRDK